MPRKPYKQQLREGNPGKRPLSPGVVLPEAELAEPDWLETFPIVRDDKHLLAVNKRAREVARREWRRVVPVLRYSAGLADVDTATLRDYCICVARIDQCERDLSTRGLQLQGERGWQKNGASTIVSQYRAQYKTYIQAFGLSPSARAGLKPVDDGGDDDDAFD